MTAPAYLTDVPNEVLAHGPTLLAWCHNRGLLPPSLAALADERQRRNVTMRTRPQHRANRRNTRD